MRKLLRTLWEGWKAFAHRLGQIQTAILLSLVYHLTIGPIGVIGRLRRHDLLQMRESADSSYWVNLPGADTTLDRARKQF